MSAAGERSGSYTYSVVGTLPNGPIPSNRPSTGAISGTPTVGGSFSVQVRDGIGNTATSCTFTIGGPLSLPCPATTSGQVGASFSSQVSATGGVSPYAYSVVGILPSGLTLNPSTGAITGTPTATGSFSVLVRDAAGSSATSCTFVITPGATISISFDNNAGGVGLTHTIGGTITLSSAAPQPNGTTVTLSANPAVPGLVNFSATSVTIPAGNTTGTFMRLPAHSWGRPVFSPTPLAPRRRAPPF